MPNIYDHNFRIKYKAGSDNERYKMLSEFRKDHYPKSHAWAKRYDQKIYKEDSDDIFEKSMMVFHEDLLNKEGTDTENLPGLFYTIFINKVLKKMENDKKNIIGNFRKTGGQILDEADKIDILRIILEKILSDEKNGLDEYCKAYYRAMLDNLLSHKNKNLGNKLIAEINAFIKNNPTEFQAYVTNGKKISLKNIAKKNTDCRKKLRQELKKYGIKIKEKNENNEK